MLRPNMGDWTIGTGFGGGGGGEYFDFEVKAYRDP